MRNQVYVAKVLKKPILADAYCDAFTPLYEFLTYWHLYFQNLQGKM